MGRSELEKWLAQAQVLFAGRRKELQKLGGRVPYVPHPDRDLPAANSRHKPRLVGVDFVPREEFINNVPREEFINNVWTRPRTRTRIAENPYNKVDFRGLIYDTRRR